MASINDKLRKYKSLFSTTLSTGIGTGTSDTITPATVTGLPTDTAITLTIDRVDSSGTATPSKLERIKGIISGGNLIDYVRGIDGTTEQAHSAGAVVEMVWNAADLNDIADWGLVEHGQDGKHTSAVVTTLKATGAEINTGTEDAKIVTPKAIADSYINIMKTGWILYSTVVPTLGTADAPSYPIVFAGVDLTSMLGVGMKVKFTQNSATVFGIITKISFSTNTTVTLYCGTDYSVANTGTYPITNFNYSTQKAPLGFPLNPEKWRIVTTLSAVSQSSPTQNVWYNINGNIVIPIGCWHVEYILDCFQNSSGGDVDIQSTLSTANNSASDDEFSAGNYLASGANTDFAFYRNKFLSLTTKTTYYLNMKTAKTTTTSIFVWSGKIRAVCAYL